jgi:hypothetical protein
MNPRLLLLLPQALASQVPRGVWPSRVKRASACMMGGGRGCRKCSYADAVCQSLLHVSGGPAEAAAATPAVGHSAC